MSKTQSILWGALIVCIAVGLSSVVQIHHSLPIPPRPFMDQNPFKFELGTEESLAFSVFGPHVWYNNSIIGNSPGLSSGTGLAPGTISGVGDLQLPTNPDHLPVCFEFNYGYFANSTGSGTVFAGAINGTNHSEDSGCPLWPYVNIAGHAFGPGFGNGKPGVSVPSNDDYVEVMDFRQDGMYFNSVAACGGNITINTATFAGGTVTLNLASNPEGSFGSGLWSSTGNGEYMQVVGSSVAALNSVPGQTYTVTGRTTSSLSFAGTAAQACASSCGKVYMPYLAGSPPVTVPVGLDGNIPNPTFNVENSSQSTANVDWSEAVNILCFPLTSCPNPFSNIGCGIGNTMQ